MNPVEVKVRLLEAAARLPQVHQDGWAAGVQATAQGWYEWIFPERRADAREILGLPKKKS